MSTSPMDFQYSLRQISEGVRQEDKRKKRLSDDKQLQKNDATDRLTTVEVNVVDNKASDLPLDAKHTAIQKKNEKEKFSDGKKNDALTSGSIRESYKGNFLDIDVG